MAEATAAVTSAAEDISDKTVFRFQEQVIIRRINMKRLMALAASLTLLASMLTGCGNDDESSEDKAASTKAATSQAADDDEDADADDEDEDEDDDDESGGLRVPGKEDAATEAATEAEDDAPAAKGTSFKRGSISKEGVYSSEYAGFSFKTPDNWTVMTEDQLMALMNIGLDYIGDENALDEELLKQAAIFDYSARDDVGRNITFMFENLEVSTGSKLAKSINEKEYLASLIDQLGTVSGVEYSDFSPVEKVELGGQTFYRQSFSANYTMMNYTVKQFYYVKKYDGLMMYIIMTSGTDGGDMTSYEKNFLPFD